MVFLQKDDIIQVQEYMATVIELLTKIVELLKHGGQSGGQKKPIEPEILNSNQMKKLRTIGKSFLEQPTDNITAKDWMRIIYLATQTEDWEPEK